MTGPAPRERAPSRVAGVAASIAAALAHGAAVLLVGYAVMLVLATAVLATHAPLWNDELFTYYIARLPTGGDVWTTLATGVEQVPFSFYLVTRASLALFGDGALGLRLPEILGFVLMGVCVYAFVARRSSPAYGIVALLVPLATRAWDYAYEARGYALVLGFGAAALVCWQRAADGRPRRRLACLGLAASLAAGVGSHYYGILIVAPLLVGELSRSLGRRRVDWPVLASFAGALVPIALFAPLVVASDRYATTFWAIPTWDAALRFYQDFLLTTKVTAAIVLVVVLAILTWLVRDRAGRAPRGEPLRIPRYEVVALVVLLALPFLGVVTGKLVTGAFTERYALSAVVGVAIVVALAARQIDGGTPILALALIVGLGLFGAHRFAVNDTAARQKARDQMAAFRFLEAHRGDGAPIVISSPHDFFELSHVAAEHGGPHFLYLTDPAAALRYVHTDAVDLGVLGMRRVAPLHVAPYRRFVASHSRFRVYGEHRNWDWLTSALRADGATLRVIARNGPDGRVLLDVRWPPGS